MPTPRVWVTRPDSEAHAWVQALQREGIAAQALPLIAIGPSPDADAQNVLEAARASCGDARAVMFVSGNAVAYFLEPNRPPALMEPAEHAPFPRAWAPGPGTVRALRQAGVDPARIDSPAMLAVQFDSEALWAQVQDQIRPGDRVLIVRGTSGAAPSPQGQGRDWLAQQILQAGGTVDFVVAYARSAPTWSAAERAQAQDAAHDDALWLFSSSEAVANLQQLLPEVDWHAAQALTTHPRIAQAAQDAGFGRVQTCRPALTEVVASIKSW